MNPEIVHYANLLFGVGMMTLIAFSLVAVMLLLFGSKENKYLSFIKKYFIEIGFLVSISAVLVSLFYSEIVGFVPCKHCWIQRIFIFSQAFIFGVAWLRKDRNVFWYSLPLAIAGFIDAIYLTFIYYFRPNSGPCDASGVSCVQRLVNEFGGYVSIPSLSFAGFLVLLSLLAVTYFYKKE